MCVDDFLKNLFQLFLSYVEINFQNQFIARNGTIYKSQILRQDLIEQESTQCRFYSPVTTSPFGIVFLRRT